MGNVIAASIAASASKYAAKQQADAMREIYRWGYGYPDWLTGALQQSVTGAQGLPEGWDMYMRQLGELGPEAYEQQQEIDRLVDALKARPELTEQYRQLAKGEFGTASRALEEMGLQGGALERARLGLGEGLAKSLLEVGIRGEQSERERMQQIAQLSQLAAGLLPTIGGMYAAPIEAGYAQQGALQRALGTATGIPGYQYTPPQIPQMGEFLGPAIGGAFSDIGQALAYNYGMRQPTTTNYAYSTSPQYTGWGSYYGQGSPAQRSNPYSPYSTYGVYD